MDTTMRIRIIITSNTTNNTTNHHHSIINMRPFWMDLTLGVIHEETPNILSKSEGIKTLKMCIGQIENGFLQMEKLRILFPNSSHIDARHTMSICKQSKNARRETTKCW